jgi:hypothetical protein
MVALNKIGYASITNEDFWDCECSENYIHSKSHGNYCPRCRVFSEDQPDSVAIEVEGLYKAEKDDSFNKTLPYDV